MTSDSAVLLISLRYLHPDPSITSYETIGKERLGMVLSWIISEAQEIARTLRELDVTILSRDLKETASL
ncbi:MAG TPA: hypothetical protein VMW89_14990 [Desulfatiglandales bacterium]|nr:hypothetical protein [Desulfatiglandales bacterium]